MKNSLISLSIATVLASSSMLANASSVTIPNTFTSGSSAVAADVNANFDALATSVNDNDSRVTVNESAITANTTTSGNNAAAVTANTTSISNNTTAATSNSAGVSTNTSGVATNLSSIGVNNTAINGNAASIGTNSTAIGVNATNITTNVTDIANLQPGQCPADMVSAGSFCIDLYENSVYEESSLTTQLDPAAAPAVNITRCSANGSDCGDSVANAATAIFAGSIAGVLPNANISWHQASQACANVGKRLPTLAEWQIAASGTKDDVDGDTVGGDCNTSDIPVTEKSNTGAFTACVSTVGAFDMVGNISEWVADLAVKSTSSGFIDMDAATGLNGIVAGDDFDNSANPVPPGTNVVTILDGSTGFSGEAGTLTQNRKMGFRCAL